MEDAWLIHLNLSKCFLYFYIFQFFWDILFFIRIVSFWKFLYFWISFLIFSLIFYLNSLFQFFHFSFFSFLNFSYFRTPFDFFKFLFLFLDFVSILSFSPLPIRTIFHNYLYYFHFWTCFIFWLLSHTIYSILGTFQLFRNILLLFMHSLSTLRFSYLTKKKT